MTSKDKKARTRTSATSQATQRDEQALLRTLVAQATLRGETLTSLARTLGVSYERLAQWRRGDADIRHAQSSVLENAARYLGLPTVLVMLLAGVFRLEQFAWPGADLLQTRLERELERMRQHRFLGGFVPKELDTAEPAVKLFVAFLFHELGDESAEMATGSRWLSALHRLTLSHGQVMGERDVQLGKDKLEDPLF